MANMNYLPIEKLTEKLSLNIKALKAGELNHTQVNELVKTAQEVYNRMVILEFQMHEKRTVLEPNTESDEESEKTLFTALEEQAEEAETEMPEFNLNINEEIEEISAPETHSEEAQTPTSELTISESEIGSSEPKTAEPEPELKSADPEIIKPVSQEQTPISEIIEPEPKPVTSESEPEIQSPELILDSLEPVTESIPEAVKEAVVEMAETSGGGGSESLAEKFENAPIASISKAYSLNEKFQFMRVLTGNNSEQFNALVEVLDNSSSLTSAITLFENSVPLPEGEDRVVYDNFRELISRRFS